MDHELKMMEVSPAGKRHDLLSRRVGQMDEYINKLKEMQDDIELKPKQLDYITKINEYINKLVSVQDEVERRQKE